MQSKVEAVRPGWVSDDLFPEADFTQRLPSYALCDEGQGKPVVFVHGPTWSFEFESSSPGFARHTDALRLTTLASVCPPAVTGEKTHPAAHADNLSALLVDLDLAEITLYLTDWGGPIGLDFARKHQDKVSIVIANSWCWPVAGDFHFAVS